MPGKSVLGPGDITDHLRNCSIVKDQARTLSVVGREALESSSAAFQATAKPSQLPTQSSVRSFSLRPRRANKKSPMSL